MFVGLFCATTLTMTRTGAQLGGVFKWHAISLYNNHQKTKSNRPSYETAIFCWQSFDLLRSLWLSQKKAFALTISFLYCFCVSLIIAVGVFDV